MEYNPQRTGFRVMESCALGRTEMAEENACSVKEPKELHSVPRSHEPRQLESSREELSTLFHTQFQGLQFLFVRADYCGARLPAGDIWGFRNLTAKTMATEDAALSKTLS